MLARKLTVVALAALVVAACGSSSKTSAPASPTSTPSGATTTAAPSSGGGGGGGGGDFCALMRKDVAAFQGVSVNTKAPKDLHDLYASVVPEIEHAATQAPAAIKSDFDTLVTSLKGLVKALADANYDISKLNPDSVSALENPKFAAASGRITTYLDKHCNIKGGS